MRLALLALLLLFTSCRPSRPEQIILASTTSTEDSGLFGELLPAFEAEEPGYKVMVIAVGSGEALEIGRRGDADVLLVHSPAAESVFVAQGNAIERLPVMYNDFVIVGSDSDPAGIRGERDAAAAFRTIAEQTQPFVSRGDRSGTHSKELQLWRAAGINPDTLHGKGWYYEIGQGMGETLGFASEKGAYTLSDRGTYLARANGLRLGVLSEGDPRLRNLYHVITVRRARNPEGAEAFARWLTSDKGRAVIETFGVERFDQPLFRPLPE